MSATRTVPAAVPSVFHHSHPWTPSFATKRSSVPRTVSPFGLELARPEAMSLTRTVPASVPSVFQSSLPWASYAAK